MPLIKMSEEDTRLKRLEFYAIANGHEYTWQKVKELIDIAELAIDKQLRNKIGVNVWKRLFEMVVGPDRSWVKYEAEFQIWRVVGENQRLTCLELMLTTSCSTCQRGFPLNRTKIAFLVETHSKQGEGGVEGCHESKLQHRMRL